MLSQTTDTTTSPESTTDEKLIFQAVGIIRGEVNLSVDRPTTITLNQKQYRLYPSRNPFVLKGLQQEIEKSGDTSIRLIVSPFKVYK